MKLKSVYKVPNGKLLKIFMNYDAEGNLIKDINITGDFFAYPEEAVELLEKKLRGARVDRDVLFSRINAVIEENDIEFIGLNVEGLTKAIMLCVYHE